MLVSFLIYFTKVKLTYSIVLISAVQQSDSAMNVYAFLFIFFSIMVYHRILKIFPYAIQ